MGRSNIGENMKSFLILVVCVSSLFCGGKGKPDKAMMERAKNIYNSNCSVCHGMAGYGDGVSAGAFNPPPRNFHLPTEKWVNGKTIEGITKTLTYGIEPNMWKYAGDPREILPLAYYVLELGESK